MAQPFSSKSVQRHYAWKQPRAAATHRALAGAERDINYGWITGLSTILDESTLCRRTLTGLKATSADVNEKRSLRGLATRNGKRSLRRSTPSADRALTTLKVIDAKAQVAVQIPLDASDEVRRHLVVISAGLAASIGDIRTTIHSARKFGAEAFRKGKMKTLDLVVKTSVELTDSIALVEELQGMFTLIIRETYGEEMEMYVREQSSPTGTECLSEARREIAALKKLLFNEGAELFLQEEGEQFDRVRSAIEVFADFESDLSALNHHFGVILNKLR